MKGEKLAKNKARRKYEYSIVTLHSEKDTIELLQELGKEGWLLILIQQGMGYFYREVDK